MKPFLNLKGKSLAYIVLLIWFFCFYIFEAYYWGTISEIFPPPKTKKKQGSSYYSIDFPDGDVTKKVTSDHLYRYLECTYLMKQGWLAEDTPPKSIVTQHKKRK